MDSLDSKPGHHPSTCLDARCDGRSETTHNRGDQGAEDVPRQGGRCRPQNRDGLAPTLSIVLAINWRRQHPFLPPNCEWATSPQWHPSPSDWRSGDLRPGSSWLGLCGALLGFLPMGAS